MKSYSIAEYMGAGCMEVYRSSMIAVHRYTQGKMCDTGCWAFHQGRCLAYRKLTIAVTTSATTQYVETVRQEADRRGISISRVRKERRTKGDE
jgi:hypothetical protein